MLTCNPSPDANGWFQALELIFTALGLSFAAGLRAYLPLLAVALGADAANLTCLHLSPGFQWMGSTWFIVVLGVLTLMEFSVDKVPGLDHVSDAIHTVVRPVAGALIMAGVDNPLSHWNPWVAAAVGAILALTTHGIKTATRPVVTATTVGMGNPVVSVGEDIATLFLSLMAVFLPIIALIVVVVLLLVFAGPINRGLRRFFGWDKPRVAAD